MCWQSWPPALFINALLRAPCLRHVSTFDKALLFAHNIPRPGLWNEVANKLAFYVYLRVGVFEERTGGGREAMGGKKRRTFTLPVSVTLNAFFQITSLTQKVLLRYHGKVVYNKTCQGHMKNHGLFMMHVIIHFPKIQNIFRYFR